MSKTNDRVIYKKGDQWLNKANGNSKASTAHETQKQAYDKAKSMLQRSGGGEITIRGTNGLFREKIPSPQAKIPKTSKVN